MPRRPKGMMNSLATNYFHLRNPYVIAWWSFCYPGFGHISMGNYVSGFLLFFWEMLVNTQAKVNLGILYSFTGRFDMAKGISFPIYMAIAYTHKRIAEWIITKSGNKY